MIGKPYNTPNPTVYTSPWDAYNDPTAQTIPSSSLSPFSVNVTASPTSPNATNSLYLDALLTALELAVTDPVDPNGVESDEFRMYEFKVRGCTRAKAHDWTECSFAHPGEKARRRDPRRFPYSGTACADFRKGGCRRGDACEFAHGVFECWLHPTRYRTRACKDGPGCTRRVCFFAHSPGQIRALSGLPSPGSIGPGSPDPFEEFSVGVELSPTLGRVYRSSTVGNLAVKLRDLQLSKVKSMSTGSGWKGRAGLNSPRLGPSIGEVVRAGFYSQPDTLTQSVFRVGGVGYPWDEEPNKEVVGLSGENWLGIEEPVDSNAAGSGPDIGWVSELVK